MTLRFDLIPRIQPLVDRLRTDVHWVKRPGQPPVNVKTKLTEPRLARHLNGGDGVGCSPILPGTSHTLVGVFDLDAHKGESTWEEIRAAAQSLCDTLALLGFNPIAFRSTGGHGIHVYLLWDSPQDAYSVRQFMAGILAGCGFKPGTGGVKVKEIEIFPKQDAVPAAGFGSMFVLPLSGKSVPLAPDDLSLLDREAPFTWTASPDVPRVQKPPREPRSTSTSTELATFARALAILPNEDLDYDAWRNVIFSIHAASGGSDEGLDLAQDWSAKSPKHNPEFLEQHVWPYITDRPDGITDRYVINRAAEHGFLPCTPDDFDIVVDDTPRPARHPFTPIQAAEFAAAGTDTHWLIKNVLPFSGTSVIYGASTSGKTFMALDMAFAIALGQPWRGCRVKQGRVIYIAAEGAAGVRKRLKAYAQHYGIPLDTIELYVIPASPSLLDRAQIADLIKYVNETGGAALTIFDTFAQVTAGGNENSGEDMGKALKAAQDYGRATGSAIVLIHHSGKDEARGARGWSGIKAAVDAELEVVRSDDDRVMTVTKLKDGEDGAEFGFKLLTIPLGVDEGGEVISSCVVEHTEDGGSTARTAKARRKLGPVEKAIYQVLADAQDWVGHEAAIEEARKGIENGETRRFSNLKRAGMTLVMSGLVVDNGSAWQVVKTESVENDIL